MPGGTAYYFSLAMATLGARVAVITKLAGEDAHLADELQRNNITAFVQDSPSTTAFTNVYPRHFDGRQQFVTGIARPFRSGDVEGVSAPVFHLGPLTRADIPLDVLRLLAERATVSLDVQGYLRDVRGTDARVELTDWADKEAALPLVGILKADEAEARVLTGETELKKMALKLAGYGPREVIITRGGRGSLVYSEGELCTVPAFPPRRLADPTGCGDTYMAGYLYLRSRGQSLQKAGEFAARTATAKLEKGGPLLRLD